MNFAKAFSVHLLTATGAALAFLAMLAAGSGDWQLMFLWLVVALVVDGIDGPLARYVEVKKYAGEWDGELLDLIIDYLTYVFIPAYALSLGLLTGPLGLAMALIIVTTGAMYFADTRMKTADKSFSGFPGCWNMVVLVMFVVHPPDWLIVLLVLGFALLQFITLKFVHPVRTVRWRSITLPVCFVWVGISTWAAWVDFAKLPYFPTYVLVAASLYLLLAGIVQERMEPED